MEKCKIFILLDSCFRFSIENKKKYNKIQLYLRASLTYVIKEISCCEIFKKRPSVAIYQVHFFHS